MVRVGANGCIWGVIRQVYGLVALLGVSLILTAGLHGGEIHIASAELPHTVFVDAGSSDPDCPGQEPCEHDTLSGLHRSCSAAACSLLAPGASTSEFLPRKKAVAFPNRIIARCNPG
jgi:hypothetical protein